MTPRRAQRRAAHRAGSTRPVTSPRLIRPPSVPGAVAPIVTVSPSSRKVGVLPSASVSGWAPPSVSSIREPYWPRSGPLTVPEANRSPCAGSRRWRSCAPAAARASSTARRPAGGGRLTSSPLSPHLEHDVQAPGVLVVAQVGAQVGQWRRVPRGKGSAPPPERPAGPLTGRPTSGTTLPRNGPGARTPRPGCRGRPSRRPGRRRTRGRRSRRAAPACRGGTASRRRSRPPPRCPAAGRGRSSVRRPSGPCAARGGGPPASRRPAPCPTYRGSRWGGASSWASAVRNPGGRCGRGFPRGAGSCRSRRSRFPLSHLHGSGQPRSIDLTDRRQSARMYEAALIEGGATDVLTFVDAALLLEVFDDLAPPGALRAAWQTVVGAARRTSAAVLRGSEETG